MVVRILFVCHGNICRSPMAEFVMKDMVRQRGLEDAFEIASCATSSEELGNDIHKGTKKVLDMHGVIYDRRCARRMTCDDYRHYDYIVAMDRQNIRNMGCFVGDDPDRKVSLLMEHAGSAREVSDPWYTGDFTETYRDVCLGCRSLLDEILGENARLFRVPEVNTACDRRIHIPCNYIGRERPDVQIHINAADGTVFRVGPHVSWRRVCPWRSRFPG